MNKILRLLNYKVISKKFIGDQKKVKKRLKFSINKCNNSNFKYWGITILITGYGYIGIEKTY